MATAKIETKSKVPNCQTGYTLIPFIKTTKPSSMKSETIKTNMLTKIKKSLFC